MTDLIGDIIKTALGGLIGSGLAYLIWIRQKVLELRHSHDTWLREARYAAYTRLWKSLEMLALHAPPSDVNVQGLEEIAVGLRRLYFDSGLLLTNRARDVFMLLQECLGLVMAAGPSSLTLRQRAVPVSAKSVSELRARVPKLGLSQLESSHLFDEWLAQTTKQIRSWRFALDGAASDDALRTFLLLQYLASSLRTVMTADLNSRDTPLLQPSALAD